MTRRALAFLAALLPAQAPAPGGATPAAAQEVVVRRGTGEPELDERLDRVLARGDYLVLARDTVLAAGDTVRRDVLVLQGTAAIDATVEGDLIVVDANLFLRPRARIAGAVTNLGGGYYPSALATVGGDVVDRPLVRYTTSRDGATWVVHAARAEDGVLVLDGPGGFAIPTYDRVNGLGLDWGLGLALPVARRLRPELHGRVRYWSERGDVGGAAELRLRLDTASLAVGFEEVALSNESWFRGDLKNSASYFFLGKDYHDHYAAERAFLRLSVPFRTGGVAWEGRLAAQREEATSLFADDPWSVRKPDVIRPNLAVDDGVISSLTLGADGRYLGTEAVLEGGAHVEVAARALDGDFAFGRLELWTDFAVHAIADHTLIVETFAQLPLPGTGTLPLQRWTWVGGSGTLTTFPTAAFRGDRILFAETRYRIPMPRDWRLPVLGVPDLELLHYAGMGWTEATSPDLEQNVGLRLRFLGINAKVVTDPSDPIDTVEFSVGVHNPFGAYPWERTRTRRVP